MAFVRPPPRRRFGTALTVEDELDRAWHALGSNFVRHRQPCGRARSVDEATDRARVMPDLHRYALLTIETAHAAVPINVNSAVSRCSSLLDILHLPR
jgi:hypothetical protein